MLTFSSEFVRSVDSPFGQCMLLLSALSARKAEVIGRKNLVYFVQRIIAFRCFAEIAGPNLEDNTKFNRTSGASVWFDLDALVLVVNF